MAFTRKKALRGARKIHFRELPWLKLITIGIVSATSLAILCFVVIAAYHEYQFRTVSRDNTLLQTKVADLTVNLEETSGFFQLSLKDQKDRIAKLQADIDNLTGALDQTSTANEDLIIQLENARNQNDTLRNKLDTLLGSSSRNGAELSPAVKGSSGLALADLKKLTQGTGLAGIEQALLDIERDYNVNALYALAVAKLETGTGTSFLCKNYNNLFGMRGGGDWYSYDSKSSSVIAFGKLMHKNYFAKGFDTLEKIGPRYAQGSTTWALKAKYHMLTDMRRLYGFKIYSY